MGDADGHDDDRHAHADGRQQDAHPPRHAQSAQQDEDEHDGDGERGVQRAQDESGNGQDDEEGKRDLLRVILRRVGEGLVEDHVPGQVMAQLRMGRPGFFEQGAKMVRDLGPCRFLRFREREADGQPGRAPVAGYQLSDQLRLVQGDVADPIEIRVAEGHCILHERGDGQIVLGRLGVEVVGERIDPDGVRRPPRRLGQFLDGGEGFTREHGPFPRGDGDQRGPRSGIRVLQRVEGEQVGIVLAEQHAIVAGDGKTGRAGRGRGHHQRRKADDPPPAAKDEIDIAVHQVTFPAVHAGRESSRSATSVAAATPLASAPFTDGTRM